MKKKQHASRMATEFDDGYKRFLKKRGLPMPKKWSKKNNQAHAPKGKSNE